MEDLLVMSQIAGRRCALSATDVQSVIEIGAIAPVPRAPAHIVGITAMRSQALTVIDCRQALGLDPLQWECDHRAIVVEVAGYSYALLIDSIEEISTAMGEIGTVPGGFGPEWSRVATGMIETRIGPTLLIDLTALIAGPEAAGSILGAAA